MEAFKCLMGAGLGSRVRAANDKRVEDSSGAMRAPL